MADGLTRVRIGEVTRQVSRRVSVKAGHSYPLLGVRWYGQGPFHRETVDSESSKASQFFRVNDGDFLYNRLFAWKGSFGVIPAELDGYFVSGEFPLFETDPTLLLPEYLELLMSRPAVWAQIERESTGSTTTSRNRWKEERFVEFEVLLPSVSAQRRAVDLLGSCDRSLARLLSLKDALKVVASAIREEMVQHYPDTVMLGDLLQRIDAGKSPVTLDRPPTPGERAVLKVSAVRPGWFDPTQAKAVPAETALPEASRLGHGDLLITRANTTALVAAVCRVESAPTDFFLCDKTLRLQPRADLVDAEFLVDALATRAVRAQIELAATGTSASMKNISQAAIRALRVPAPPIDEQRRISAALVAARSAISAAEHQAGQLATLRSALLSDLLSGHHEIPDSYDALLEQVS